MKALTFKRTALAAALLAAAGSATAATSVSFGVPTATADDTTNVVTKVTDVVAYESLINADVEIVATGDLGFVQIKLDGAIFANDILTLEFTNGGISEGTADNAYAVSQVTPDATTAGDVDIDDINYTLVNKEFNASGSISKIDLRIDENVTAGAVLYIGTTIANGTDRDWTAGEALTDLSAGLPVEMDKGTAAGVQISVEASINYVAANLTDTSYGSSTFGTTVTGMSAKFTGAGTKFIDHAADDLELVGGEKAVTATGLVWSALTTIDESTIDLNMDGDTADKGVAINHGGNAGLLTYSAKVVLPADCADYLKKDDDGDITADAVTMGGANMTKSTTETCTWSKAAPASGEAVVVNFSGEDVLVNSSATASYTATYDTVLTPALNVTSTLYTLSGDVQTHSGSFATMPYVYSFPGAGAFSYVKVDNSGAASNAKTISLVIDGTIQETVAGSEPMPFVNYFLKDVAPGEISEFTGSEILDALINPRGDAALGYEDEALAGADASKGYHMSVTLRPVSTGATLADVNFDGVNTSGIGRTPIKFITDTTTLSSVKTVVDENKTSLGNLDVSTCVQAAENTYATAATTFAAAETVWLASAKDAAAEGVLEAAIDAYQLATTTYNTALDACDD